MEFQERFKGKIQFISQQGPFKLPLINKKIIQKQGVLKRSKSQNQEFYTDIYQQKDKLQQKTTENENNNKQNQFQQISYKTKVMFEMDRCLDKKLILLKCFKPYNLKDYKQMQYNQQPMGGLGKNITDEIKKKQENLKNIKNYSLQINIFNKKDKMIC